MLFDELGAREDGGAHREVEGMERGVREGFGVIDDSDGGWREKTKRSEDESGQIKDKTRN